jgi:poly-gamma-glutamate capsule biosynthesis protein CapA/YwtB (metallophosphatase superfamily)
MPVDT